MKPRQLTNLILLIAFAAVSIVGMEFLAVNVGQPAPFASNYVLHATFPNADGVPLAADVAIKGVLVGRVTGVGHTSGQLGMTDVTMTFTDDHAVPVYSDGTAVVRPKTLLGEKYVDLSRGSAAGVAIPSGGYLPAGQGSKSVSNDEIFNSMDAQTRANVQKVLDDLNTATAQRAGDVQAILPNLNTVVSDLVPVAHVYAQDQPQVDSILLNLNTILQTTADENQQLSSLLQHGNIAFGAIASRDTSLINTMQEAGTVADEINAAAAPTVAAQRQALAELAPALQSTNGFLDAVVGPQAVCGGNPCGIDQIFTGTVTGNLNYPNDQLTVTSNAGETTTNEWASMFSRPASGYSNGGASHSALNLVLSFHCDAVSQMLSQLVSGLSAPQQAQIQQTCQTGTGHVGSSGSQSSFSVPNEGAMLLEGSA